MKRLLDSYREFPHPVPEILAAAPATDTIRTDLFDFQSLPGWSAQNVVLLGDAAHAMTPNLGQGGAQAIEDAFILAEQCHSSNSIAQALRTYERIRLPRVQWIAKTAWGFGQIAHWQNPLARWARDASIRWTPSSVKLKQLDRLYSLDA
jgi:2-polyprenyl-6-methoxyphenol hydroxylase-like FAD-dependent oxidoreductase